MCYPKPGPRCSPHARQKLAKAQTELKKYDGDDEQKKMMLKNSVVKAQKEYFTSPHGIKALRAKALETGDGKYAKQAEEFAERRKEMIAKYKASQEFASAQYPSKVQVTKLSLPNDAYHLPVEYDYDHYGCSGSICNYRDYDDYCRDAEYEGLRIDRGSLNPRAVLAYLYKVNPEDIPDSLVTKATNELDLDSEDGYEVYASGGYYGDEAHVDFAYPDTALKTLKRYYYELPDAKDEAGVLQYVRGKGVDTAGLTPIEAIKKQLNDENHGKTHQLVERSNTVTAKKVNFDQVEIPQKKHFDAVEPRPVVAPENVDAVCGVLVQTGEYRYRLVDGYHRMKHKTLANGKTGKFIVLTRENAK